ncbi:hypothetical protein GP486_004163 [Trichoglossum hirsutum]|uniref:F-box domain-containing protein n=1 Tax=Trichoglossum hirsutum TaxID=265104 RepID=A0A9P8LBK5_9PEZI|nr:hypothetical protein GP486_004163 [Trichoglossum hirsutum]
MIKAVNPPLLTLPAELLHCILSYLSPESLAAISGTCHRLRGQAENDLLWRTFVQDNVPSILLESPLPCRSFKELYIAHYPHWFLLKHKVWFSDGGAGGMLIVARYDPHQECIEAYRLVAERRNATTKRWEHNPNVIVCTYELHLQLHFDEQVLKLDPVPVHTGLSKRFSSEIPLPTIDGTIYSTFFLAQHIPRALWSPEMQVWPPYIIPALQRTRNEDGNDFRSHIPKNPSEASDQTFRIRRWMEFGHLEQPSSRRMGESVTTFGTLVPESWTPTEQKPWQGIWVGDYSGHGCEFLLLHQPDTVKDGGDGQKLIYQGRLEAIKLTGDPHVPRGQYSWIAEDIGSGGFLRIAEEEIFRGARVVKSEGHLAGEGFVDSKPLSFFLVKNHMQA